MKIIKQNDSAGGLIFKQNTNGNAMKQNYNFGKAWKSYNPGTAYIDIDKVLAANTNFTVGFFYKNSSSLAGFYTTLQNKSGINNFAFLRDGANNLIRYNATNTVHSSTPQNIYILRFDTNNAQFYSTAKTFVNLGTPLAVDIPGIRLLRAGASGAYHKFNGLFIYDRSISISEAIYRDSNLLGNELLNTSALWAEYPLNIAEILNTGGADFVGVRDISGNNRHQPILSLPVGSLQDQLTWANANCFEIW